MRGRIQEWNNSGQNATGRNMFTLNFGSKFKRESDIQMQSEFEILKIGKNFENPKKDIFSDYAEPKINKEFWKRHHENLLKKAARNLAANALAVDFFET